MAEVKVEIMYLETQAEELRNDLRAGTRMPSSRSVITFKHEAADENVTDLMHYLEVMAGNLNCVITTFQTNRKGVAWIYGEVVDLLIFCVVVEQALLIKHELAHADR